MVNGSSAPPPNRVSESRSDGNSLDHEIVGYRVVTLWNSPHATFHRSSGWYITSPPTPGHYAASERNSPHIPVPDCAKEAHFGRGGAKAPRLIKKKCPPTLSRSERSECRNLRLLCVRIDWQRELVPGVAHSNSVRLLRETTASPRLRDELSALRYHDSTLLDLLRQNRNYRYTWMGQVVSEIGDYFNNIAVFALVMEKGGLGPGGHRRHARPAPFRRCWPARSPAWCWTASTASAS